MLPTLSKYLEKIIHKQLINYLQQKSLLSNNQHGFREGKSINSALTQLCRIITNLWENKKQVSGTLLDIQKAFDSLNRKILIKKLKKLKIKHQALNWLIDYLSNRKQTVEIEYFVNNMETKSRSTIKEVKAGIPQGSVLGPLLFLIYIDSFPEELPAEKETVMFADDTTVLE